MKQTTLSLLSGLALLVASSVVSAADAPPAKTDTSSMPVKIGVVDMRQVLQKSPQMVALSNELEKQFKPREAKITAAQTALQADVDKLNKNGSVMSDADKNQLQDKIVTQKATIQTLVGTFQQDLNNAQNQGMQKILEQVAAIVDKISKADGYTVVLPKDVALYFRADQDITDRVSQAVGVSKEAKPAASGTTTASK